MAVSITSSAATGEVIVFAGPSTIVLILPMVGKIGLVGEYLATGPAEGRVCTTEAVFLVTSVSKFASVFSRLAREVSARFILYVLSLSVVP